VFVRVPWPLLFLTLFTALTGVRMRARAEAVRAPETIGLHELLQRALVDPPRVLSALAALQRAEAERGAAQAAYFPVVGLQGSQGIVYDNRQVLPAGVLQEVPSGRLNSTSHQTLGTASLDWSLLNGARNRNIKSATLAREAQDHALSSAQRLALSGAFELYMRALAASLLVADAELTRERRTQQHEGVAGLVKAGLRPSVDETRARIEAVAATYRLEVRKVEERAIFAALAVSVGRDPDRPLRPAPLSASPFGAAPRTMEAANAAAFEHRPELKQLRTSLAGRQAELSTALWRRAPTIGVSGTASASYIDIFKGSGYGGEQYSGTAQVYLRVQTFDAAIWRSAAVARANMLQTQRALESTVLDIKAEVAEAGFAVERTRAELERATQVLSAAEAAREAQNGRYRTGVASLLELLDAENVEQNARLDRITAERDHQLAHVRLLAATGLIRQLAR
jgi:outer membrane protein TolC